MNLSQQSKLRRLSLIGAAAVLSPVALFGPSHAMVNEAAPVKEKTVAVATADGMAEAAIVRPARGGRFPGIVFWPDNTGISPNTLAIAHQVAEQGFVVLVPNAWYRSTKVVPAGFDVASDAGRKAIAEWRAKASDSGIDADAASYVAFLDRQPQVDKRRRAGMLGYQAGVGYAVRSAAAVPSRVGAVAGFYPLGTATVRPNSPHLLIPKSHAAYLIGMASDDDAREPDDKEDIRKKIAEGHLQGTVEVFPAKHGWASPTSPSFDKAAADRAVSEAVALFKASL